MMKSSRRSEPSDSEFKVSVITPVYNAVGMVRRSVESATPLDDVGEVILIEDGSPDGAIKVCRQLESEFDKVRLLQHPDGENRGPGASRNLGLAHARFPFIAFLDADDWYLPNRFEADRRILRGDPTVDGVYNALANHYDTEELRRMWLDQGRPEFLSFTGGTPTPEELPLVLLHAHPTIKGEFHTITVTVRRELIDRVGSFHPELRLQQDTHLWKRLSAFGRLGAGNLSEPVAIRGVHTGNRMTKVEEHAQYMDLWWSDLGNCFRKGDVRADVMQAYRRGYAEYSSRRGPRSKALLALATWLIRAPGQLKTTYGFFDLTLLEIFDSNRLVQRLLSLKNRLIGVAV